ncbi:hypothetical protein C8J56DRAFT_1159615 [Mycena floridula]|nr:hypothetical protein C8J56DRAFT_1159615 [Mycena floridula]
MNIKPLIGTADDGLYMRLQDITELSLKDLNRTVATRQGDCKVFEGVTYHIPDDYNKGQIVYRTPHNTKKEGILGVPRIYRHLVFFNRGNTRIIDMALVPALRHCFNKNLSSLNPGHLLVGLKDRDPDAPKLDSPSFDQCLAMARLGKPEPFDAFNLPSEFTPAILG